MTSSVRSLAFLALGLGMASISRAAIGDSGSGKTTRYWDCCKGSCSWSGKADVSSPVQTCSKDDTPLSDPDAASGCDGGSAYMCSDQSPWAVSNDLAYGFAAVSIPGGDESSWCCACYELTFTTTSIAGKKMIVQATNTGGDLAQGQFDLAIPGGGVGLFNACTDQYGAPPNGWGAQYGGISTDTCSTFPSALEPGCSFRFGDFFEGADNPEVEWKQVTCPKALTDKTGCVRDGETPTQGSESGSNAKPTTSDNEPAKSSTMAAASSTEVAASPSSVADAAPSSSSAAAPVESAPVESSPAPQPPAYGATTSTDVAAPSSSSSVAGPVNSSLPPSGGSPPYPTGGSPTGTGSSPQPTDDDGEGSCKIEYVYVDESF